MNPSPTAQSSSPSSPDYSIVTVVILLREQRAHDLAFMRSTLDRTFPDIQSKSIVRVTGDQDPTYDQWSLADLRGTIGQFSMRYDNDFDVCERPPLASPDARDAWAAHRAWHYVDLIGQYDTIFPLVMRMAAALTDDNCLFLWLFLLDADPPGLELIPTPDSLASLASGIWPDRLPPTTRHAR